MPNINVNHKKYNGQCIMSGNVISNQQYSNYIRGFKATECNGFINPEGHLQAYDLATLPKYIRSHIKNKAIELTKGKESVVLYCFRHYNKPSNDPIINGYLITDTKGNVLFRTYGSTVKKEEVMDACISAIQEQEEYYLTLVKKV